MFFPLHDLTHYAVETELGIRDGFYGEEFNENTARFAAQGGRPARRLSDDDLARIRKRRAELFSAWQDVASGRSLELDFPDPIDPSPQP